MRMNLKNCGLLVLGGVWDGILIAAIVGELVLDVMVAAQFLQVGQEIWAVVIYACLWLANIPYCIAVANEAETWRVFKRWDFSARFICLLPVLWHLYPIGCYVAKRGWRSSWVGTSPVAASLEKAPKTELQRAVLEQELSIQSTVDWMLFCARAARGMTSWGRGFMLHSAAVAAPQAIIQLIAISIVPNPTRLQYASICLALFNIMSRFYVVSAFHFGPLLFKFLMISFDLFSSFYLFSSLFSQYQPAEVSLFGRDFSRLNAVFVVKFFVVGFGCLAVGIAGFITDMYQNGCIQRLRIVAVISAASCLIYVPMVFALECIKFSYGIIFFTRAERAEFTKPLAVLFAFLRQPQLSGGKVKRDVAEESEQSLSSWMERLSFLYFAALRRGPEDPVKFNILRGTRWNPVDPRWMGLFHEVLAPHAQLCQLRVPSEVILKKNPKARSRADGIDCILHSAEIDSKPTSLRQLYTHRRLMRVNDKGAAFNFWKVFNICHFSGQTMPKKLARHVTSLLAALYAVCCLLSVIFPFLNYAMYFSTQHVLQHFCFWVCTLCIAVMIPLVPISVQYVQFTLEIQFVFAACGYKDETFTSMVTDYYTPSARNVVMHEVPQDLVCRDILSLVAAFVPDDAVDLSEMTLEESHRYRVAL